MVGGVGGTGVITIGQLLGMAAHLEAAASSRRTPAAWRRRAAPPGATSRSPTGPEAIHTTKVDTAKADLVIACDAIVGAGKTTMSVMREGRTFVALNTHGTPTAAFVRNPTGSSPAAAARPALAAAVAPRWWAASMPSGGGAAGRRL